MSACRTTGNMAIEGGRGAAWKVALLVALAVVLAALHVWVKVELGDVAAGLVKSRALGQRLTEERVTLLAALEAKKAPAHIGRIAVEKLGMVYPDGRRQIQIDKEAP